VHPPNQRAILEDFLIGIGVPSAWLSAIQFGLLGRLVLAAFLGGIVGFEREISGKPAGLRTNLLICVGAALLTEISIDIAAMANEQNVVQGSPFRADPARIAAQIVSGIGFLGAGTILQARGNIIGLTTAATIWVVAAIGMAVGSQSYVIAVGATLLVVFSLGLLGRIEGAVVRRQQRRRYLVTFDPNAELLRTVEDSFGGRGLRLDIESVEKSEGRWEAQIDVAGPLELQRQAMRELIGREGVHRLTRIG